MTEDARFEDGADRPLQLMAQDADDLSVIAALVQDAVLQVSDIAWQKQNRRVVMLLNRVRWEDKDAAGRAGRAVERVRALLVLDNVEGFAAQGIPRGDAETVLSLLTLSFEAGDAPSGQVLLTLAGDGAFRAKVESLDVVLKDVTRPYAAVSGKTPDHPDD